MEEIYSRSEDVLWLAQKLKNALGSYVSFNWFGIDNPILTGIYSQSGYAGDQYRDRRDVRFYIKFCKDEFLRIQIPEAYNDYKDICTTMESLVATIADINLGYPLAIYKTNKCLTTEYAFKNKEAVIERLCNGKMFDDGNVTNLNIIRTNSDIKTFSNMDVFCKKMELKKDKN